MSQHIRPSETDRITTVPFAIDICRCYRYKVIDAVDSEVVLRSKGSFFNSGRMLDATLWNAWMGRRIDSTNIVIIDDVDEGEIDRFVFGDRWAGHR